jgi:hypothetical protein
MFDPGLARASTAWATPASASAWMEARGSVDDDRRSSDTLREVLRRGSWLRIRGSPVETQIGILARGTAVPGHRTRDTCLGKRSGTLLIDPYAKKDHAGGEAKNFR